MSDPIRFVFIGEPNPEALKLLAEDILRWEARHVADETLEKFDGFEVGRVQIHEGGKIEKFAGVMVKARRPIGKMVAVGS